MSIKRFILYGLILAVPIIPTLGHAAFITDSASITLTETDWAGTVELDKFDSSLGTLQSVEFLLDGYVEGFARAENISGSSSSNTTLTLSSEITLETNTSVVDTVVVLPTIQETENLSTHDGNIDWAGPSGTDTGTISGTDSISEATTDAGDLALYTAGFVGDVIQLAVSGVGKSEHDGGGNLITWFQTSSSTDITVRYTYDPAAPVPEPASMILFGSGIFAVAFVSRKKRKEN